jgi:hypothetical protein
VTREHYFFMLILLWENDRLDLSFALEKLVVYFHLYCTPFGEFPKRKSQEVTIEVLMESAKWKNDMVVRGDSSPE